MTKLYQITETKEANHQQFNCLKDAEITRLRKRINSQDKDIDRMIAAISEMQEEIDELKATMAKYNDLEAV